MSRIRHLYQLLGVRLAGGGASGPSYDADAVTLFAAMSSQPDSTRKQLISDTIASLKSAGIWDELDELWFLAAHDSQAALLGWKRYKDLTAVNAPTFETDRGYTGNGTTSYLSTNFVPSTDGVQYTLNDASFGVYSRTNSASNTIVDIGADDAGTRFAQLLGRITSNNMFVRVHRSISTGLSAANTNSSGLLVARRSASDAQQVYRNGSQLGADTAASTAVPTIALFVGAQNASGTPNNFSTRQYAFAFVGASLSAQQQSDLATIVESYMDSIGAGVVA